jgi:hypothetical protein
VGCGGAPAGARERHGVPLLFVDGVSVPKPSRLPQVWSSHRAASAPTGRIRELTARLLGGGP